MFGNKIFVALILAASMIFAQNRGNNLAFQGINELNNMGVTAAAMGGAYTSQSGSVEALFYNPAALRGLSSLQLSTAANFSTNKWFENQVYRPNRYFVTLPFYLEGLYIPDPADNGKFDHERMWDDNFIDSSYVFSMPTTGQDPESEEAADWVRDNSVSGFNHVAAAFPFRLMDYNFVVAASYSQQINVEDYDRNHTYLNPHPGYMSYGEMGRVNGIDTLNMDWYNYERSRSGELNNISAALSFELNKYLSLGVGGNFVSGETTDEMSLDKIGYFTLVRQNQFRFSYDTAYQKIEGTSKFSSNKFNFGLHFQLEKITAGIRVDLPYTLEREFSYTETIMDSTGTTVSARNGTDNVDMPATYSFGFSFRPVDNFTVAFDYQLTPYSENSYDLANEDSTLYQPADQHIFRFGMNYQPVDFLSLQAGYSQVPQTYVPDGSAVRDEGPASDNYSAGIGFHTEYGTLRLAYEYKVLTYYDSYFSNTNYNTYKQSNLIVGYTITL